MHGDEYLVYHMLQVRRGMGATGKLEENGYSASTSSSTSRLLFLKRDVSAVGLHGNGTHRA